ncbi:acetyl-CoA carboxylase biotin carboxyl carrier protein [Patescibacteria group bacterium]
MEIKQVKEILKLIEKNSANSVEIEFSGIRIKVIKKSPFLIQKGQIPEQTERQEGESKVILERKKEDEGNIIKAPLVGTFYRSADPDKSPFVIEGTVVKKGDILCIIEAMKLMNEIEAEKSGTVKEIFLNNGDTVQYGTDLFLIKPAK